TSSSRIRGRSMTTFRCNALKVGAVSLTLAMGYSAPTSASAATDTPQLYDDYQLQGLCSPHRTDKLAAVKRGECQGYILGVIDAPLLSSASMSVKPIFCIPPTV